MKLGVLLSAGGGPSLQALYFLQLSPLFVLQLGLLGLLYFDSASGWYNIHSVKVAMGAIVMAGYIEVTCRSISSLKWSMRCQVLILCRDFFLCLVGREIFGSVKRLQILLWVRW